MKMNKKVFALALAAIVAAGSVTVSAANDDNNNNVKTEQTKAGKKEFKKGDKKQRNDREGKCRKGRKGHKGHCNLFNGVELTAEQQTAIKAFKEKQHAEQQAARQQGHEAFMTELKSVLTPEQYQQVEQNAAKMKEARADKKDGKKDGVKGEKRRGGDRHQQKDGKQ